MSPLPAHVRPNDEHGAMAGLLIILLSLPVLAASGTEVPPVPPDFDDSAIIKATEALARAWAEWKIADGGLELRFLRERPQEARLDVERAWEGYLGVLDKRHAYSEAVSAYIDRCRAEPRPRQTIVTIGAVFEDHVQLLGFNLSLLEARLGALRDAPQWIAIRRSLRDETAEVFSLQSKRRSEVPLELSLHHTQPAVLISSLLYSDSERQVADRLRGLWAKYYQALSDAVEPGRPAKPLRVTPPGK